MTRERFVMTENVPHLVTMDLIWFFLFKNVLEIRLIKKIPLISLQNISFA